MLVSDSYRYSNQQTQPNSYLKAHTKDLLPQFILSYTSCLAFNKKFQGMPKTRKNIQKKKQSSEPESHMIPESDMTLELSNRI